MSLNLHSITRGPINAVNSDIAAVLYRSDGYDTVSSGKQVPKYLAPQDVTIQVQALSTNDLTHTELVNLQGSLRAVYLFGTVHAIVRTELKGGDKLLFAQVEGEPMQPWLVVTVLEPWSSSGAGWCKLAVQLQQH